MLLACTLHRDYRRCGQQPNVSTFWRHCVLGRSTTCWHGKARIRFQSCKRSSPLLRQYRRKYRFAPCRPCNWQSLLYTFAHEPCMHDARPHSHSSRAVRVCVVVTRTATVGGSCASPAVAHFASCRALCAAAALCCAACCASPPRAQPAACSGHSQRRPLPARSLAHSTAPPHARCPGLGTTCHSSTAHHEPRNALFAVTCRPWATWQAPVAA